MFYETFSNFIPGAAILERVYKDLGAMGKVEYHFLTFWLVLVNFVPGKDTGQSVFLGIFFDISLFLNILCFGWYKNNAATRI